jgi:TRAP-type transport system periplasmic protein
MSRAWLRRVRGRLRSRALLVRGLRRTRTQAVRRRAARPEVTTLVFANPYGRLQSVPEVAPFLANIERLGEGRLRILVMDGWTSPRDRDEERTLLEDVARGIADLGWVGARAVGAVLGVRSLDPLHAPLLFPDEEAVRRCIGRPDFQEPLLSPLQEAGIVGLALLPGGLRRPFGITGPLRGPADWDGKVIRTHTSLPGEAAVRALGATPVLRSSAELSGGPAGLDGMDLHAGAVAAWGYSGWLTWNVPLWPRILLLAASRAAFQRLSAGERAMLEEAARMTVLDPADIEDGDLPESVTIVEASGEDLALLRRSFQPVYDELRSTSEGEMTFAHVERLVTDLTAD